VTYVIVLVAYYFVQTSYNTGTITKLDHTVAMAARRVVAYLAKPFRQKSAIVQKLTRVSTVISDSNLLYTVLLAFTDQQLVTGLAILIAGYKQINSISEYHFAIVQNMATLSFTIHSATAVILEDNIIQDPVMKTWRGVAIISTQFMTLVTYLPLGHNYWMASYGMPTRCLWQAMPSHYNPRSWLFWSMIIYMSLILLGIARTLDAYFPRAWGWINDNKVVSTIRSVMIDTILLPRKAYALSELQSRERIDHRCLSWLWYSIATFVFIIAEILWSEAFGLLRRWALIVNNLYYTFILRSTAVENGRLDNEDAWGFGQAVPMFLLVLPVALVLETSYGAYAWIIPRRKIA
jgi:hypothetical protein